MISTFREENSNSIGFWQKLDPRIRLICVFSLLAVLSITPLRYILKFSGYVVLGVVLYIISRVKGKRYLGRVFFLLPMAAFLVVSLLIFPGAGGEAVTRTIMTETLVKMFLVFGIVGIMVTAIPFREIILALDAIRTPFMVVTMLNFMHRYLYLFLQEAERVIRAIKSRSSGNLRLWKDWRILSSIIFVFLIRVVERGYRVYLAMLSRGDIVDIRRENVLRFHWYDYVFGGIYHAVLFTIFFL